VAITTTQRRGERLFGSDQHVKRLPGLGCGHRLRAGTFTVPSIAFTGSASIGSGNCGGASCHVTAGVTRALTAPTVGASNLLNQAAITSALAIKVNESSAIGTANVLVGEDHLVDAVIIPLVVRSHLIDPFCDAAIGIAQR